MVLIISTDLNFRSLVGAELQEKGYEVEGVETLADTLRIWTKKGKPIGLVLIEASGQDFNGSTLTLLAEISRKSIVVVCVVALEKSMDFARYGVKRVIAKPVSVGDIVAEIVRLSPPPLDRK